MLCRGCLSKTLYGTMNNGSIKVLGMTLFLFTVYNHTSHIIFLFQSNHGFITSNISAIALVVISMLCVIFSFWFGRYFWWICVLFFLWYPFSSLFLSSWYPDLIIMERIPPNVDSYELSTQNLGIPILLCLLSILTYVFASRNERTA